MPRWQYKVISHDDWFHGVEAEEWREYENSADATVAALNKLGEEGWEFCGNNGETDSAAFFKRKKGSSKKWEYLDYQEMCNSHYESIGVWAESDCITAKRLLNRAGEMGWELCAINDVDHVALSYVMKRPKN